MPRRCFRVDAERARILDVGGRLDRDRTIDVADCRRRCRCLDRSDRPEFLEAALGLDGARDQVADRFSRGGGRAWRLAGRLSRHNGRSRDPERRRLVSVRRRTVPLEIRGSEIEIREGDAFVVVEAGAGELLGESGSIADENDGKPIGAQVLARDTLDVVGADGIHALAISLELVQDPARRTPHSEPAARSRSASRSSGESCPSGRPSHPRARLPARADVAGARTRRR